MSERSLSVSPVIEPCAGGVIGLGIGYSLAPRKYSLKRLLVLNEDKFQKIYTPELKENMSIKELKALNALKEARLEFRASRKTVAEQVKNTARNWVAKFIRIQVPNSMQEALITNRTNLTKAIADTNYIELNKAYRAAKAAVTKEPNNTAANKELTKANINLSKAKAVISSKIELYKDSVKNISNYRLGKVKNEPVKYANIREAYHEFLGALAKRRTAASYKLFELTNNKNLIKNYNTLSSFLPKARTKSALAGAAIVGTMTSLLMLSLTNSARKSA